MEAGSVTYALSTIASITAAGPAVLFTAGHRTEPLDGSLS